VDDYRPSEIYTDPFICPDVQGLDGTDCALVGPAGDRLERLVGCLACVAEFAVDCLDRVQVPEFAPYPAACRSSCCAAKATPGCDAAACSACVCGGDPYCCNVAWDGICVAEATDQCAASCPACGE
jgi:hypothetical protein